MTPDPGARTCGECDGVGECPLCEGEGWLDGKRCRACLGKRRCLLCAGAGQVADPGPPRPPGPPVTPTYTGKIRPRP